MTGINEGERLQRALDRLQGYVAVDRLPFSRQDVERYNDEIGRIADLLPGSDDFLVPDSAFRDDPYQAWRNGRPSRPGVPLVVLSIELRENYAQPAIAAIQRAIDGLVFTHEKATMTPQQLGNQYIDACLTVGRTLVELVATNANYAQAGVPGALLGGHLVERDAPPGARAWRAEHDLLVRSALKDLSSGAVDVFERDRPSMGARVRLERRNVFTEPDTLIREIGLRSLEPERAELLAGIAALSFDITAVPAFLPRDRVDFDALRREVRGDGQNEREFLLFAHPQLIWLEKAGLVSGPVWAGECKVRVTMAGIIWLGHHERVTMEEARRQERTQVTINNDGTIYAISTGPGAINQIIASPIQPGDWSSLQRALAAVQVPEASITELHDQLEHPGANQPGWLRRWADKVLSEIATKAGSGMLLASGDDGARMLMEFVNQYRS